jgi:hypothetical protein
LSFCRPASACIGRKLDADLSRFLEGILGSQWWKTARLGAIGGRSRSKIKVAASRKNAKLR